MSSPESISYPVESITPPQEAVILEFPDRKAEIEYERLVAEYGNHPNGSTYVKVLFEDYVRHQAVAKSLMPYYSGMGEL